MARPRPTNQELVKRVQALEDAIDRMMGAFKADLAALREDLRDTEPSNRAPPTAPATSSRTPSINVSGTPKPPGASRTPSPPPYSSRSPSNRTAPPLISEQMATTPKKKDPRADD